MTTAVKEIAIRCGECQIDGVRARRVGVIEVVGDAYTVRLERRNRHIADPNEHRGLTKAGAQLAPSYARSVKVVEPGERADVKCGRTHRGQPGVVVINDETVASALRREGFDPGRLTRLGDPNPWPHFDPANLEPPDELDPPDEN